MIYAGSYPFLFEKLTDTVRKIRQKNPQSKLTFIISSNNMRRAIKEYLSDRLGLIYNAEFFTKLDIARELTGIEPLNNLEKEIIIESILKDKKIHVEGLSKAYSETIQKLKESRLSPEDIPENENIRDIFKEYEKRLSELSLKDREDIIIESSYKEFFTDFLIIFGFHSLTEIDRDMFRQLLNNVSFVFIPINPDYSILKKNPHLLSTFEFFRSFRLKSYVEPVSTENQKLTSYMFSEKIHEKGINCKNITFIVSRGKKDEILKVAKSILKLKKNTDWHKIGVIVNDLEKYIKDIKSVFQEYKIPYYLSEENRFIDQLPFKKMYSLFNLKENNFSKIEVLNSISKEIIKINETDLSYLERDLIESAIDEGFEDIVKMLNTRRYKEIAELLSAINKIPEKTSIEKFIQEYLHITKRFFQKNEFTDKFQNILENILSNDVLEKLYPEITYSEFNNILLHYLQEEDVERRLKGNIVQIRTPNISEGLIFEHLFFIDMNEGKYPSTIKEDPVINSQLRMELERKGFPKLNASYWQQIVTFITVFNSSKYIYLSFKDKDDKGNDLSPSILVEEMLRVNYGKSYYKNIEKIYREDTEEIMTLKEFKLKNSKYLINTDSFLKKLVEAHVKRESVNITEYEGKVNINLKSVQLTPSKLQTFSDCPYRFFLRHIIDPDSVEIIDTERISPDEEGTAIHEILEFVYKKRIYDSAVLKQVIPSLVKEKFKPLLEKLKPSARVFESRRISVLSNVLVEFVINDIRRIKDRYLPEVIETKKTVNIYGFKFTGKIDRADRDIKNGDYIIYDYKTGKKRISNLKSALLKGEYLQLIIYKKFLEKSGKNVKKIGLLFVKDFSEISAELENEVEKKIDRILKIFIEMIKDGYFFPNTESESCSYCEFVDICDCYYFNKDTSEYISAYKKIKKGKLEVD
ncbi:PD-(D/E)XK nuclease family protein [Persephonella sp.]